MGFARSSMTDEAFQQKARESIRKRFKDASDSNLDFFISRCAYHAGDYSIPQNILSHYSDQKPGFSKKPGFYVRVCWQTIH